MRTLIVVVGSVVALLVALGANANAQERPERLTADVFIEASFPEDIVQAVRKADTVALRIEEVRHEIELRLKEAEKVYDSALRQPDIPIDRFAKIFAKYEAVLFKYWSVDQYLKTADEIVESRYYVWTLEGVDPALSQVFQKWREATRANYISASSDEDGSRLMLNIGIDRINRQLRKQKQKLGRYKAPKFRRIND